MRSLRLIAAISMVVLLTLGIDSGDIRITGLSVPEAHAVQISTVTLGSVSPTTPTEDSQEDENGNNVSRPFGGSFNCPSGQIVSSVAYLGIQAGNDSTDGLTIACRTLNSNGTLGSQSAYQHNSDFDDNPRFPENLVQSACAAGNAVVSVYYNDIIDSSRADAMDGTGIGCHQITSQGVGSAEVETKTPNDIVHHGTPLNQLSCPAGTVAVGIDYDSFGGTLPSDPDAVDAPIRLRCAQVIVNNQNVPQCDDDIDNDGDGKIDFPQDPGCTSITDDDESNPLPKQCSDGIDNDGDGKIDFPLDPGCNNSNDDDERDTPQANFTIAKTDNVSTTTLGSTLNYQITVTNTSSTTATNVTVTDTLPGGVTFLSANSGGASSNGTVTWSNLTLSANDTRVLTVSVRVNQNLSNGTVLTNTALVSNGPSASDSTTVNVQTTQNIAIDITDSQDPVEPRDDFSYRILVTNLNATAINDLTITQNIDSGTDYRSSSNGGHISGNTVTWNNVFLPGNGAITLTSNVRVRSSADDGDILRSTASALNASDTETTRVEDEEDDHDDDDDNGRIRVDVTDSEDPVEPDESFSYTIRVRNDGQRECVNVRGFLDRQTSFRSASDDGHKRSSSEVEWNNICISKNSSRTLTLHVRVDDGAEDRNTLRFRVRADDDEATEFTQVTADEREDRRPRDREQEDRDQNVTIDKQADRSEVGPGGTIYYTLTIRNSSNTSVQDIVIEDVYPTTDFNVHNISSGGADNGRSIRWDVGTLSANATRTYTYAATINGRHGQTFRNNVSVRGRNINQAADSYEVRVIEQLPQTGYSRLLGSTDNGSDFLSPPSNRSGGSPVLPGVLWTMMLSLGFASGGLIGKRYFF